MTGDALFEWARGRGATAGAARTLARFLLAQAAGRPTAGSPARHLLAAFSDTPVLPHADAAKSSDGTVRFAVRLGDGELVETVLIHQPVSELRGRERWTVCLSSQVGCARGCVFCETGRLGLVRNLSAAEIVAQYALAARHLGARPANVVFMGMGEPLDNLEEVLRAIAVLREPGGFAVPERRITVSTVGILPRMDELFSRTKAQVAVSLHALDPEQRRALLPVARKWSLTQLRECIARAPRSVLLQWTLIEWLKENSFKWYDLGGIDPERNPGVYHFKKGLFGADVSQINPLVACDSLMSSAVVSAGLALQRAVRSLKGTSHFAQLLNRQASGN